MKLFTHLALVLTILTGMVINALPVAAESISSGSVSEFEEKKETQTAEKATKKSHILLLGVDTTESGDLAGGRSDTIVLISGSEEDGQGSMTSIPRDSLVNIPGHGEDKINHAYAFGGAELAQETVENLLGIEIDNYVVLNMTGLGEMVEVVGGVTVVPPTTFEIEGYTFQEGVETELDGDATVAYVRERKSSGGDYARQARQRDVIQAILTKTKEANKVTELPKILKELNKNMSTSFGIKELTALALNKSDISLNVDQYQLEGHGEMINGGYYVIIDEDSFQEFKERVK